MAAFLLASSRAMAAFLLASSRAMAAASIWLTAAPNAARTSSCLASTSSWLSFWMEDSESNLLQTKSKVLAT